jgi:hypothetical protein
MAVQSLCIVLMAHTLYTVAAPTGVSDKLAVTEERAAEQLGINWLHDHGACTMRVHGYLSQITRRACIKAAPEYYRTKNTSKVNHKLETSIEASMATADNSALSNLSGQWSNDTFIRSATAAAPEKRTSTRAEATAEASDSELPTPTASVASTISMSHKALADRAAVAATKGASSETPHGSEKTPQKTREKTHEKTHEKMHEKDTVYENNPREKPHEKSHEKVHTNRDSSDELQVQNRQPMPKPFLAASPSSAPHASSGSGSWFRFG